MVPAYPIAARISEGRVSVQKDLIPEWCRPSKAPAQLNCVPLRWRRRLAFPPGRELEAWLLWSKERGCPGWLIDAAAMLGGSADDQEEHDLRRLIYPSTLSVTQGRHRLACSLFTSLAARGDRVLWIVGEDQSLSLWTDFGFQSWHGGLSED